MTHADIKKLFLIEYDKAEITSSYPSLTAVEMAVILDKAYLAWIAQKVTGTNVRRAPLEVDTKAVADIQPLISTKKIIELALTELPVGTGNQVKTVTKIPEDVLYILPNAKVYSAGEDGYRFVEITQQVSHADAVKFMYTEHNMPWIKHPVMYEEDGYIYVLFDPYRYSEQYSFPKAIDYSYIRKPQKFEKYDDQTGDFVGFSANDQFELGDTSAQEIINLAIVMAAETVESPRQQTKANIIPLEP